MSYRRKALNSNRFRGSATPQKFHQQERKFAPHTPNRRYHAPHRRKRSYGKHGITPRSQQIK